MAQKDSTREPAKRDKYATRACNECQRRKVKCSGDVPCLSCETKELLCKYTTGTGFEIALSRRAPKRARRDPDACTSEPGRSAQSTSHNHSSSLQRSDGSESPCPSGESQRDTECLREQVDQLQRHVDVLLRRQDLDRHSLGPMEGTAVLSGRSLGLKQTPREDEVSKQPCGIGRFEGMPDREQPADKPDTVDANSPDGETDTFELFSRWPSALALSSKISALRSFVVRDATPRLEIPSATQGNIFITLPAPDRLAYLLKLFFEEFDCTFPCIIEVNVRKRLSEAFRKLQYSKQNCRFPVSAQHYKTVAVLCSALAYAECSAEPSNAPSETVSEVRPGWRLYLQGRNLMQYTEISGEDNADLVTYHLVAAAYTLRAEMLRPSSYHTLHGFQAALNVSLNNQDRWHTTPLEFASRKALWWTLYFLDKRIAQKSGIAYFIRESEARVSDFRSGTIDGPGDAESNSARRELLQNIIIFSKLWTQIWDNFFAPAAPKCGKWDEIQIIDARIMASQQQTPTRLLWTSATIDESIRSREPEPQIRKRLLVYLRYQVLRLAIRHGTVAPPEADRERRRSGFAISKDVIESVSKYMSVHSQVRGSGYLLTSSLVEALYYIVPEYHCPSTSLDPSVIRKTLREASSLLHTLSHNLGPASRALKALRCVLLIDESVPVESSSSTHYVQGLPTPRLGQSSSYRGFDNMPDQALPLPDEFWMYVKEGEPKSPYGSIGAGGSSGTDQASTVSAASVATMYHGAEPPWISRTALKPLIPDYDVFSSSSKSFPPYGFEQRNSSLPSDYLSNQDGGWGLHRVENLDYFDFGFPFAEP